MIFINVILPVVIIIAAGYLVGKLTSLDIATPSHLTLYLFTPCLFFNSMLTATTSSGEILEIVAFAALLFAGFVFIISMINALGLKYPPRLRNALYLACAFPNSGNFGLPVIYFAFAQAGFEQAIIFAIFQSFLVNSAGVYFAARSRGGAFKTLLNILKLPGFYALLLALGARSLSLDVPLLLLKPINLLGQAAIPTLLIVLGMQLARRRGSLDLKFVGWATFFRLALYPLIAFCLLPVFFPYGSLTAKVLITVAAAPAGITPSLLAIKFGTEPELVTGTVFLTTLLSIATVSLVLFLTA